MKRIPVWLKSFFSAASFVLVLLLWTNFSPREAGGEASYVIIIGQSMEPNYYYDDLVITHQTAIYEVGDAVAYRHPRLGIIFHRIIALEGDHFVMQGDNNAWLDSHAPTAEEILGKKWLHFPGAGRMIRIFRSPGMFALVVGALIVIIYFTSFHRNSDIDRYSESREKGKSQVSSGNEKVQETIFSLAILGLVALFLGVVSFSQPLNLLVQDSVKLIQVGRFDYQAQAVPGVYDQQNAQTGDPIFRQVSNSLEVTFLYQVQNVPDVTGFYQLLLIISDDTGWSRTVVLQDETAFTGNEFVTRGVVDFESVEALIAEFEDKTGVSRTRYLLTIMPVVQVFDLKDIFSSTLSFYIDDYQITPLAVDDAGFSPSETYSMRFSKEVPNTLSFFGLNVKVLTARIISVIGFVLLSVLGGLFSWSESRVKHAGEVAEIAHLHGERLVSVETLPVKRGATRVSDFKDLVRLAERQGVDILHAEKDNLHTYFVQLVEGTYYIDVEDMGFSVGNPLTDAEVLDDRPEEDA